MSVPHPNPVDLLIDRAVDLFHDHFDTTPNIGARAPGRVRLTGYHLDRLPSKKQT